MDAKYRITKYRIVKRYNGYEAHISIGKDHPLVSMDTNKMPHLIRRRHLNCFDYIYDVIEYTRDYKIIVTTLSTKFGIFVTEEIIKEFNKIIDKKFA